MRDYHRSLLDYARELGCDSAELERRTKHWILHIAVGDKSRKVFVASTPGRGRALANAKADIRKVVQGLAT